MMLNYLANNSVGSSSSSDEEDNDFILLELAYTCIPKRCFETRLLNGRLLEQLKMDVIVGGRRRTAPHNSTIRIWPTLHISKGS